LCVAGFGQVNFGNVPSSQRAMPWKRCDNTQYTWNKILSSLISIYDSGVCF